MKVILNRLLDALYPSACEVCETGLTQGGTLCQSCSDALPRLRSPFCETCGECFDGLIDDVFMCPNCHDIDFHFDFATCPLRFNPQTRELIHRFKYQHCVHLANDLGKLFVECFDQPRLDLAMPWLIVPVPLHWKRQQWRKFNQSYELAKAFSRHTRLPLLNALKRPKHTPAQAHLTRTQRLKNLTSAFEIRRPRIHRQELKSRPILLIDDVFTTGATTDSCAKVLKEQGKVEKVIVLTLMRG